MASTKEDIVWHSRSIDHVAAVLQTEPTRGLTSEEAANRLQRLGPNELREKPSTPFWKLVLAQLNSFVVILLIVASMISALLTDYVEAAAILPIVVLNSILGIVEEQRAEEA